GDELFEITYTLFGEGRLAADGAHDISGRRSARPDVAFGKPCRDGVASKCGKDHWNFGKKFPYHRCGIGCRDYDERFKCGQFAGEHRQAIHISAGEARGQSIVDAFNKALRLQTNAQSGDRYLAYLRRTWTQISNQR